MTSHTLPMRLRRVRSWGSALLGSSVIALGLAACGGSGMVGTGGTTTGPAGCSTSTCGTAYLTITDATGDFTSYTVDVTSLRLTKADGAVVETLPVKTRIDFTQLVNVTEFVTAATIPNGDYVSATMTVDYTNAAVFVEVNGAPVQATLVDGSGKALSTLQLTVQLDNRDHLVIAPGVPARLALDFNLAASNTVDVTTMPPVVIVKPVIVASVVPIDSKDTRVRGTLVSVAPNAVPATYTVNLRPFDDDAADRGQLVVATTAQTTFEIDGKSYLGSAGITALAALPVGSLTVAVGVFDATTKAFTASSVLAGTSVRNPAFDRLRGTVISRSGNTLVVRGANLEPRETDAVRFMPHDVTLTVGSGTTVTEVGDPTTAPTIASISVGSAITAFGTEGTDSARNPTLDASSGQVRLEITSLLGLVTSSASPGHVTIDLQALNGLSASVFSFAGTGTSAAMDANPANYDVLTGALPVIGIMPAALVRLFGFVTAFGSAPPDFDARTLVDFAAVSAELEVSFGTGSTAAFSTIGATDLVLNLADPLLGKLHFIKIGPQMIDLKTLAASPPIVPNTTGMDEFAILQSAVTNGEGRINVYNSYDDFEAALAMQLNGTTTVLRVEATGHFDQASNTFTARRITVILGG
jgi:hypothetical protein